MDRLTLDQRRKVISPRKFTGVVILLAALGIVGYKAVAAGWFSPREPLDLSSAPVLLFFNRHKGCDCEMVVYKAALTEISRWSDEARNGIQIIHIDMDRRPDLAEQYDIIRAPALFLVDRDGAIIFKQKEAISDTSPLDLHAFETAIENLVNQ